MGTKCRSHSSREFENAKKILGTDWARTGHEPISATIPNPSLAPEAAQQNAHPCPVTGHKKARIDVGLNRRNQLTLKGFVGGYGWTRTTDLGIMSATL